MDLASKFVRQRDTVVPVAAFIFYGVVLIYVFPSMVLLRSDDFGYVMSVVRTLAAGHPVTDEWLEPNNALLSSLGAIAYSLSGNFYFSTFGILFILALAIFPVLFLVLRSLTPLASIPATGIALLLLTNPVFINKASDYTGVIPYIFFFLSSLLLYSRRQYGGFFVSSLCAFGCRESAIAILALPFFDAAKSLFQKEDKLWHRSGKEVILFVSLFFSIVLIKHSLNVTYAQTNITYRLLANFTVPGVRYLVTGATVYLCALFVFRALAVELPLRVLRSRSAGDTFNDVALPLLMLALVLAACWFGRLTVISMETPLPPEFTRLPALTLVVPGLIGLLLAVRFAHLLVWHGLHGVAAGLIFLSSVRQSWWDYYFLDVVIVALIASFQGGAPRPWVYGKPRFSRWFGASIVCGAILFMSGTAYAIWLARVLTHLQAIEVVAETMARSPGVPASQIAAVPWGFSGWHFFYDYIADKDRPFRGLGGFEASAAAPVRIHIPATAVSAGCGNLTVGRVNVKGIDRPYSVEQCGAIPESTDRDKSDWRHRLPLNELEWRDFIANFSRSRGSE